MEPKITIAGYRQLTEADVALINEIKAQGAVLDQLSRKVAERVKDQTIAAENDFDKTEEERLDFANPVRWISIARTDFQTGLMALTRAVAQPSTF